jgi:hypothetical protein
MNNAKFGAGTAINSQFVATKHGSDLQNDAGVYEAFKGLMYCAEIGAKIINCS